MATSSGTLQLILQQGLIRWMTARVVVSLRVRLSICLHRERVDIWKCSQHFRGWVMEGDNAVCCFWKKKKQQPKPQLITLGSLGLLHIPFLDNSVFSVLREEARGKAVCLIFLFCHPLAVNFCSSLQTEGRAGWVVMKQSSLKTICW